MAYVQKLYAAVTTSTDAAASLDIPDDTMIEGALASVSISGADALNDGGAVEVSFASTSGFISNDTRASILGLRVAQGFLTTGGGQVGWMQFIPLNIPVAGGERIYLHTVVTGTATLTVSVWLYMKGGAARSRPNFR